MRAVVSFLAVTLFLSSVAFASVGTLSKRVADSATVYEWHGERNETIATGRTSAFAWGTRLDVYDGAATLLGTVTEERLRSVRGVTTFYSVFDASGRQVAESERVDWPNGVVRWNTAPTGVDARVLRMLDAYKSDVASERATARRTQAHAPRSEAPITRGSGRHRP